MAAVVSKSLLYLSSQCISTLAALQRATIPEVMDNKFRMVLAPEKFLHFLEQGGRDQRLMVALEDFASFLHLHEADVERILQDMMNAIDAESPSGTAAQTQLEPRRGPRPFGSGLSKRVTLVELDPAGTAAVEKLAA